MEKTIPIISARSRLTRIASELERHPETGAVAVTRRGKPVLAVVNWDLYESIMETMDILKDEDLMSALRQSIRDIKKGKFTAMAEVKRELGL